VGFPDLSTLVIKVAYSVSLNSYQNLSITVASYTKALPEVPDNNLSLKYYTGS